LRSFILFATFRMLFWWNRGGCGGRGTRNSIFVGNRDGKRQFEGPGLRWEYNTGDWKVMHPTGVAFFFISTSKITVQFCLYKNTVMIMTIVAKWTPPSVLHAFTVVCMFDARHGEELLQ
jgi:hypothetical protein